MEPEGSILCSQEQTSDHSPEPNESSPHLPAPGFATKILYVLLGMFMKMAYSSPHSQEKEK